jgi:hypothetical protein
MEDFSNSGFEEFSKCRFGKFSKCWFEAFSKCQFKEFSKCWFEEFSKSLDAKKCRKFKGHLPDAKLKSWTCFVSVGENDEIF